MTHGISRILAATGVALTLALVSVGQAAAEECLGRREIQQKIDAGELIQLSQAMDQSGVDGKIISSAAQVCKIDGIWQWRVNVMDASGESNQVTLPAE